MTAVIKSKEVNGYLVEINIDKYSTAYKVEVYHIATGRTEKTGFYGTIEKANKRFSALCRTLKNA